MKQTPVKCQTVNASKLKEIKVEANLRFRSEMIVFVEAHKITSV